MAGDRIPTDEEKLIEIAQRIAAMPQADASQMRAEKERAKEVLSAYFTERMNRNGGLITTDILKLAEKMYVQGMTTVLAESLGIRPHELRNLLGRKVKVTCECGAVFEVIEPRNIYGYTENREKLCKDCRKKQSADWSAAYQQEQLEREQDVRIVSRIILRSNPLEIDEFRKKLRHYAQYWMLEGYRQYAWSFAFMAGGGCMLCGKEPFRLFANLKTPLDEKSQKFWQEAWESLQGYSEEKIYPPIIKTAQAIYQFGPEHYFVAYPHFPVLGMPVVMLCHQCAGFVTDTHEDVLKEDFIYS
jgi:hypothetical protein